MADEGEEKKNDEEKDMELDLMAEAELLRLTRQYRCGSSCCSFSLFLLLWPLFMILFL